MVKSADAVAEEGVVGEEEKLKPHTGSCLCGSVSYEAKGLSDIWYCHCKQCQKLTGLYISAAGTQRDNLVIKGDINWLPISEKSESGHCPKCGCYMFWSMHDQPTISVLTGCLDDTSGLHVRGHIYVEEKSPHFEITDGLPQFTGYPSGGTRTM